jgi:hypothetical protein
LIDSTSSAIRSFVRKRLLSLLNTNDLSHKTARQDNINRDTDIPDRQIMVAVKDKPLWCLLTFTQTISRFEVLEEGRMRGVVGRHLVLGGIPYLLAFSNPF